MQQKQTIRLILAYGDNLCRAGLRALLEGLPGVEVLGDAQDGRAALALIRRRRPDVVLLEDTLPGLSGLQTAVRLSEDMPGVRVILLSDLADAQSVATAFRAGVKGYLLRSSRGSQLAKALQDVGEGRTHVSPGVSRNLLGPAARLGGPRDTLTPRQREILQMVAEGWSTKQIAQILRISGKTVETHRAQLMDRLGIYNVSGLVRYAIKTRLSRL